MSALSLNFFLTEPYLRLAINRSDDIIAFVALAVSGSIAAAFGRRRARSSEMLGRAREDIDALERLADGLTRGASLEAALENFRRAFRLAAIVLRPADNRVVAAAPADCATRPTPAATLDPRTLPATGGTTGSVDGASGCPKAAAGSASHVPRSPSGSTSGKATRKVSAETNSARWSWRRRCSAWPSTRAHAEHPGLVR